MTPFDAIVIGGGMITHDQLLPSLYQLRRLGAVGTIRVCSRRSETLAQLRSSRAIREAFPEQEFEPTNESCESVLHAGNPRQIVVVALPDHLHREVILAALRANHHVCTVKPLVMTVRDAEEIEREARARGVFVGID